MKTFNINRQFFPRVLLLFTQIFKYNGCFSRGMEWGGHFQENIHPYNYLERTHECFVNTHHTPGVVELSAVIGGREQGHQLTFREELVAVLNNLQMGQI